LENPVARLKKKMSVAALVALRDQIQAALSQRVEIERAELQKRIDDLTKLDGVGTRNARGVTERPRRGRRKVVARKRSAAKGSTVAPKYRGPKGETWTGRGNTPRWLAALEAEGKKRDGYLIKK
jgi:DNA-binding protein H-NS